MPKLPKCPYMPKLPKCPYSFNLLFQREIYILNMQAIIEYNTSARMTILPSCVKITILPPSIQITILPLMFEISTLYQNHDF